MSEITKQNSDLLRKSADELKRGLRRSGSLRDVLKHSQGRTALLCDVSGSMNTYVRSSEGTKTRMHNLLEAVANLPKIATIAFGFDGWSEGSAVRLLPNQDALPKEGMGGTPLAEALEMAKMHGFGHVVVVTDGEPNDRNAALTAAQGLKVDAIYVSDPPMPQFMIDLCSRTGGSYENVSIDEPKALESAIRALIGDGK